MKRRAKILLAVPIVLSVAALAGLRAREARFFEAPDNRLKVQPSSEAFAFDWGSKDTGERVEPHAFQFLPVKVSGVDEQLWMQFDLGTQSSVLYRRQLESLAARGAEIEVHEGEGKFWVEGFELQVGSTAVSATSMQVIELGPAIDWADPESRRILGTIGADYIEGHVLVVDYVKQRIQLAEEVPESVAALPMHPFSFRGRRVFLPSTIDGEPGDLYFDSGSSAFQLVLDEGAARAMATPGGSDEVYEGKAWGKTIYIHNLPAAAEVRLGDAVIKIDFVTWFDRQESWLRRVLPFRRTQSWCGNKLFLGRTLVLDTTTGRFAVSG